LVEKCSLCDCLSGQICNITSQQCYTPPTFSDDFNDNNINTTFWTVKSGTGLSVTETNQRLELNHTSNLNAFGLFTINTYDLTYTDIRVDMNNTDLTAMRLAIYNCSVTGTTDPVDKGYCLGYYINKNPSESRWQVGKRNITSNYILASGTWAGPTGSLGIKINDGIISFYENDIQKYTESFNIPTYDHHVYLYSYTNADDIGMDYFDNFTFSYT
jgi:hypothetical protein